MEEGIPFPSIIEAIFRDLCTLPNGEIGVPEPRVHPWLQAIRSEPEPREVSAMLIVAATRLLNARLDYAAAQMVDLATQALDEGVDDLIEQTSERAPATGEPRLKAKSVVPGAPGGLHPAKGGVGLRGRAAK